MIRFIDEKEIIAPHGDNMNADVAITAFSTHIFDELLRYTGAKQCGTIVGGVDTPVYAFDLCGKRTLVYMSKVGAPGAVAGMEEIAACGVKHIIAFGICGTLTDTPHQSIIVPTRAYRDEGTSYHYLPATEYIDIKNSSVVASSLTSGGIKIFCGGVWTTDGFYRETRTRANEMTRNGCVAVDMECSALQAAADFRGKQFYTFFITADSLAGEKWEPNDILELKVTDAITTAVAAAVNLAKEIIGN